MQNIALVMWRKPLAEGITMALKKRQLDIKALVISDYNLLSNYFEQYQPLVALVEIAESGAFGMNYCMSLCKSLAQRFPKCKLILMYPENNEEGINTVINLKKSKIIDDFLFYDASLDYIVSKLCSM